MRTYRTLKPALLALAVGVLAPACGSDDGATNPAFFDPGSAYQPAVDPADLSPDITNPWLPWPVGATWVSEDMTPDGALEHIEVVVEADAMEVNGVQARVVRDTAHLDGQLSEDTYDWYAQDSAGNVWYLGEDTAEYQDGAVISTEGSWTWGVGDALPGIVMLADPTAGGGPYRQEYLAGEAEDYAEVVSTGESVSVPAGDFTGCIKTHEQSAADPAENEYKYYKDGVGLVLVEEPDIREELIDSSLL